MSALSRLCYISNSVNLVNRFGFTKSFPRFISSTTLPIEWTRKVDDANYDSVVIVSQNLEDNLLNTKLSENFHELKTIKELNQNFEKELTFAVLNKKRIIYSPTGPLNRDYDDVRRIADATRNGLKKAIKIGSKNPLIINCTKSPFKYSNNVSLLAALEASYVPLEVRESKGSNELLKVSKLGVWHENEEEANKLIKSMSAVELGRIVARDIGGSDPERMSASKVVEYVQQAFQSTDIKVNIVEDDEEIEKHYPCFAAVNRAAKAIPRHKGRIVKLEYDGTGSPIDTTLLLVGKGLTYDTGGADIKYGGSMAGMHRDKCGAAFVAGFFKTLSILKPKGLRVYGTLCLTRNNVGEESYVTDEIITARSKKRIRIGNTDAEGRMAILDSLCEAKELALNQVNPHLFTIATLTGHVMKTYGQNYSGIMSNGPARAFGVDSSLQEAGELIADPYELSRIRREDYLNHKGKNEYEDLVQAQSRPSADSSRGHQGPAAFLIMGSGLEKHGNEAEKKLSYSHIDIAGSSGKYPGMPTAAPLPSFFFKFIQPRI